MPLLMSMDLEDARLFSKEGAQYSCRIERNLEIFIGFLKDHHLPCTFFVVGDVFKRYPHLIENLSKEPGFEIAWHSENHHPVLEMSQSDFRRDLLVGQELAAKIGIKLAGYRAPIFSVNQKVGWFHEELDRAGFLYSSSVLPAQNPLHGWPGFPTDPIKMGNILEIPMKLVNLGPLKFPLGGVYLRVVPLFLQKMGLFWFGGANSETPVPTYIHPYDYDFSQERYMHGGIKDSRFFNWLVYLNRRGMLGRLHSVTDWFKGDTKNYIDFVESYKNVETTS